MNPGTLVAALAALLTAGACATLPGPAKSQVDAVVVDEESRQAAAVAARAGATPAQALEVGKDAATGEPATPK